MIAIMLDELAILFADASSRRLAAGEVLFRVGDVVTVMVLVAQGRVDLERHTAAGAKLVLQCAGPGEVLAEASAHAAAYHCDAVATQASVVRLLPLASFLAQLAADPRLAVAWTAHLARAVQAARTRAEIRTLRTVRERLDAWLATGGGLPRHGAIQDLAAELGVSREALYRELARRR